MAGHTIHRLRAIVLTRPMASGYHADGGGLYTYKCKDAGSKSWIFRYSMNGRRREMGLGQYATRTDRGAERVS